MGPTRRKKTATAPRLRRARGPGRPRNRDPKLVREALLAAARRHFSAHGVGAAALRDIARDAGVTPAMVAYHFGDKQGLYEAMLTETVGPVLAHLGAALSTDAAPDLEQLLHRYVTTLAANPWLPQLIVREVFTEGGAFRARFTAGFAKRGGGMLIKLVEHEQAAGRFRTDVEPERAAQALLSLALFPFIALPVTREVFGMKADAGFLVQHVTELATLYKHGMRAPAPARR